LKLLEGIFIALNSLLANRLRSILTLIGVIIGVTTVIAVTSIIAGMNRYVARELSVLGADTFFIDQFGIETRSTRELEELYKRKKITFEDAEAIRKVCSACAEVGGGSYTSRTIKKGKSYLGDMLVAGMSANIIKILDVKVGEGRFFSQFEEDHRRRVVFVGWSVVERLFPKEDPIGKNIKIEGQDFTVVGVAVKKGSALGSNQDDFVYIPLSTFRKSFGSHRTVEIYVRAKDFKLVNEAMDQARIILRARRHIPYDKDDDFGIMTAETFMDLYRQFTSTAYLTMIGISSIALVVGGIVIMNIMLVSVTERTREIGIRKALGARRKDVLWQFLVESITLALVGGTIGIILGVSAGKVVALSSPLPAAADPFWIAVGLILATSIGLVFGVYPAMKAARLDPIEALRYE
jgi:putative ABC transport system permease protein